MQFAKRVRANDGTSYDLYVPVGPWESMLFEHLVTVAIAAIHERQSATPAQGQAHMGNYSIRLSADEPPRIDLQVEAGEFCFDLYIGLVPYCSTDGEGPATYYGPDPTIMLIDAAKRVSMISASGFGPPHLGFDPQTASLVRKRIGSSLGLTVLVDL